MTENRTENWTENGIAPLDQIDAYNRRLQGKNCWQCNVPVNEDDTKDGLCPICYARQRLELRAANLDTRQTKLFGNGEPKP